MAYAASREYPGVLRTHAAMTPSFHVLDVTVCRADALRVRRSHAGCAEVGVARCGLRHGH
jgi:hypothetical protein